MAQEYVFQCKNKNDRKECGVCDKKGQLIMPMKSNDFICPCDSITKLTCTKIEDERDSEI